MTVSSSAALAQTALSGVPATLGIEGVRVLSSRVEIGNLLVQAGLRADQVQADPLIVKLPDLASKQNVSARFTFTDDKLTAVLFTFESEEIDAVRSQGARWTTSLKKSYGSDPVEASTSPEGYRVEGWCVAPDVEATLIAKGNLVALDYTLDSFGACRQAPPVSEEQAGAFMYRLPGR